MICPHCKASNATGAVSCAQCGRAMPSERTQTGELTAPNVDASTSAAETQVTIGVVSPHPGSNSQMETSAGVQFSGNFSLTMQPGTDFGPRYRIESLLGEGGMGTVYKAFDKELGRTVAIKLVRPEFAASPNAMQRFRQELLLASKVTHKNVLRIHDLGDVNGLKFISMAY